ncbi:MAG: tRNA (adenosine(37)-N6)-dimethylallyltransferase MiaA [Verrucomicrobiota bacterium]|nr:tRNA (adenosine(37)-N6)-dimethylallyltransferase MiaA [Verrucomicrobiota bacterium]
MLPLYLVGATGTGKSSIAISIAQKLDGEIVNADAFQIYKGIEIVTDSPKQTALDQTKHHLYGALELQENCNAARYSEMANDQIKEISDRGKTPIIVGGSGLYIKSLTHGLSDLPPANHELREELDKISHEELISRLEKCDPIGASQINLKNRRYLIRALEISILAERPMSEIKNEWKKRKVKFTGVALHRPRQELYDRINLRVEQMVEEGLMDEMISLPKNISNTAKKAIGIQETQSYLEGKTSLEDCIDSIQRSSRNYAKRQITWFKREKEFQNVCLEKKDDPNSTIERIISLVIPPENA